MQVVPSGGHASSAKFGTNASGILFSWRDYSSYRINTLGPLCLWQYFLCGDPSCHLVCSSSCTLPSLPCSWIASGSHAVWHCHALSCVHHQRCQIHELRDLGPHHYCSRSGLPGSHQSLPHNVLNCISVAMGFFSP